MVRTAGLTRKPGVLVSASAFPDPPFEVEDKGARAGFDAELMRAICSLLSVSWHQVEYADDNFNGIFGGLANGSYDAVISGTTITPQRRAVALFSDPYLEFNQGLIVNRARTPSIRSTTDLRGLPVGIQIGNTSDAVARKLLAAGAIRHIVYYPYHGIDAALEDLVAGRLAALI